MDLTDKEVQYYENRVALKLEQDLDGCMVRRWDILFDKDALSEYTQKPAFILNDEEYPLGCIDMNGNMELNNDSYGDEDDIKFFSPEELMVLGVFGKKLKYGRL